MKPDRILFVVVFVVWLAGLGVWVASDEPGIPVASLWTWIGAAGLACIPLLLVAIDKVVGVVFKRRRD